MKKWILVPVLLMGTIGCIKTVTAPIPGSANQFDSDTYLALVTTDSVIQATKAQLAANAFPASITPNVKTALNDLINAYDIADTAYLAFHAAAMAGTSTPAQQAAVTADMAAVNTSTNALITIKGGN